MHTIDIDPKLELSVYEAAIAYAEMGWRLLPGTVWRNGGLVDPTTGKGSVNLSLVPRDEATADPARVRRWWGGPEHTRPGILALADEDLGIVSVRHHLPEEFTACDRFTASPTPALELTSVPVTMFFLRPPYPAGFARHHIRPFPEGSVIRLPPFPTDGAPSTWLISPWQAGRTLLTANDFAEILTVMEAPAR